MRGPARLGRSFMNSFVFQKMFPESEDTTEYRLFSTKHISTRSFAGARMLMVEPEGLTKLSEQAFFEASHLYRRSHLRMLSRIFEDPESSANDRFVAFELLKNAVIAAEMEFPICQDTGTATIIAQKGQLVFSGNRDEEALTQGVYNLWTSHNLRYSQNTPLSVYEEVNTKCNLPAQVEIYAVGGDEYRFLFIPKGGGSSNKTFLFQETKAILAPKPLSAFMHDKIALLGTQSCPPYHIVFVIGGTSPEMNLKTVKLALAGCLDGLPVAGSGGGHAIRVPELEEEVMKFSRQLGFGAQYGGKWLCLDALVIRLPRHGGSCPIGLGISCSAHRQIKAKINPEGIFLEALEANPSYYLPMQPPEDAAPEKVDLNRSMNEIRRCLSRFPVGTRLLLTGKLVVARDIAHARLKKQVDQGQELPDYFKEHIIYYAGPAKRPPGYAAGSFGPTTGSRMDVYVPEFQALGGSLVMLSKGNRTKKVTESCQTFGGFYLGAIGGVAAKVGKECITGMEVLEFPELGMEAIYRISVVDFPAFLIVDDKGNDFFQKCR